MDLIFILVSFFSKKKEIHMKGCGTIVTDSPQIG